MAKSITKKPIKNNSMKKVEVRVSFYCTEEQFSDEEFQEFLEKVSDGTFESDMIETSGLSFEAISVSHDVKEVEDA